MKTILNQWENMLNRGVMPLFEIELKDDEYLLVELSIDEKGIYFEFDNNGKKCFFDGIIKNKKGCYFLAFDKYFESLDYYLELIYQNIHDGFISVYDLWPIEIN